MDSQYESLASFYYPKPYPHLINKNDGTQIDAKDGKVMLAEIPWVRLGLGVPEDLKQQTISYSDSVKNAQALLDMPSLTFLSPMEERGVMFGTKLLKLAPRGYALLLSLVLAKKQGWNVGTGNREEARTIATYLNIYSQMKNDVEMENRLKGANNDLKNVLSESRTDINKKVMANFSLGKGARSDYIPSSNRKTGNYELNINLDNIDISEIESELIHFNLL